MAQAQKTAAQVKKTAAQVKKTAAQVKLMVAQVKLTAPRTTNADQCIKAADQTFSPLKHFTKTQKMRRMHTVLPWVMHVLLCSGLMHSVWRRRGKHAAQTAPTAPTERRTQNIVPFEKMAAGTLCCIRSL